jgi:hypothetical protein
MSFNNTVGIDEDLPVAHHNKSAGVSCISRQKTRHLL